MNTNSSDGMENPFYHIGQELYFMNYGKPVKKQVIGYSIVFGEFKDLSIKDHCKTVVYSFDSFTIKNQSEVFETKEALQNYLFQDV